jgi:transcriptional regulator with XRE-family HTH domain
MLQSSNFESATPFVSTLSLVPFARLMPRKPKSEVPNAVDCHVGARIRMRRKLASMSQSELAAKLGITFQQVQKYERGTNRVSASKLYEIARTLETSIAYFFEGLDDPLARTRSEPAPGQDRAIHEFLITSEGVELAISFPKISRGPLRRKVLDLVRALADGDGST